MLVAIRCLAAFGVGAMAAVIPAAFSVSPITADGAVLLDLAWGRVTMIDIYLVFVFGWLWIAWRERHTPRAIAWLVATLITGALALFAYLLGASMRASTVDELVLGPRRA
ncbi:MAG: hypothetical protein JJT89_08480 [Nitriliruptoraceae bacterium]|nr:hypothetical protein [Nitriliruptoraceae bacterium]